jgi:hypothetical protein
MQRLRAGFCEVKNPFNAAQVSRVSLAPEDVTAIVFWTRDPRPMLPHLPELAGLGHEAFFLVSLLDNPRALDPKCPGPELSVPAFAKLAQALPGRVAWRYDPIALTSATPPDWHRRTFEHLTAALAGHTDRVIVSFIEPYRKITKRMAALARAGLAPLDVPQDQRLRLLLDLRDMAAAHGLALATCCQPAEYAAAGIAASRCLDGDWIASRTGRTVDATRDPGQRPGCNCAKSRDIGAYDRCLFGCAYCYATTSFDRACDAYARHDPDGVSL